MAIIVSAKSPIAEHRWVLRNGQQARVGCSPWAEYSIEGDQQLREFHCQLSLDAQEQVHVQAIDDAALIVDQNWTVHNHHSEQMRILAGQTHLLLTRQRSKHDASMTMTSGSSAGQEMVAPRPGSHLEIGLLRQLGMSEQALLVVNHEPTVASGLRALLGAHLLDDAIRFSAAALPVQSRLRWCHEVLARHGVKQAGAVAELLALWLVEPGEPLRQGIARQIDWNRKQDPSTWLLASIGWTGGNLAGESSIPVPPTDQMVITGVITALNLSGTQSGQNHWQYPAVELALARLQP